MKPWHLLSSSAVVPLATLWPSKAAAHLVNTNVGEFYAGMMHPLTSAEHLLPILALGDRFKHITPAVMGGLAVLTGVILGYRSGIDMAASQVAAQFIPRVALTGLIAVVLVAAWAPMATSRTGQALRTLAGVSLMGSGV